MKIPLYFRKKCLYFFLHVAVVVVLVVVVAVSYTHLDVYKRQSLYRVIHNSTDISRKLILQVKIREKVHINIGPKTVR